MKDQTQKLLFLQISLSILTLIACAPIFAKTEHKQAIYQYDPSTITLVGTLRTRIYPGPPNYENIKQGDSVESIWLLQLTRPITVLDDKDSTSNNETETNVREVQLVVQNDVDNKNLKYAIGKVIHLTGTLFHAWSGHHHLKILMDVKNLRISK